MPYSASEIVMHAQSDRAYVLGLRAHMNSGGQASERNVADLIAMVEWNTCNLIHAYDGHVE